MKQLIKTFGDSVIGVSSGFDRLVFQGMIRPIMYAGGAMEFFSRRRILFKDAKNWVMEQTERLVNTVEDWSKRTCGEGITYLASTNIRKEAEARRRQQEKNVLVGPIGVWSCVEAYVSQDINNRFADHIATMRSGTPLRNILRNVTSRKRKRGRSVRALEPTGKDLALLSAIADPRFAVGGFQNRHIRLALAEDSRYSGKTDRQRSGMTTRSFRLLRDHGVIKRIPRSRRYQLTANGRQLVTALLAALSASTQELTRIAA